MKKPILTNQITPCCRLPFSTVYWWVKNLTLDSEVNRNFILSKINQDGSIYIDGWIVLINASILETDAPLTKSQMLDFFDCKRQPDCDQLALIIESLQVSNWMPPVTELPLNMATIDGTFNGSILTGNTFTKTQSNSLFLRKVKTVSELRAFKGVAGDVVELLGYYAEGDKPTITYSYQTAVLTDDGGAVISNGVGSWVAKFDQDNVDVRHFGIKVGDVDSLDKWQKLNSYCVTNSKKINLTINVTLIFPSSTNIYTANITGNGSTLTLDGKVYFRTDNLLNVDISGFNVVTKNNYTTLTATNGSTNIFYNPSSTYNANRSVRYENLTCTAEAPLYDGSNRLSGFIRDGGYNSGIYRNIVCRNVSNPIITNTSASSWNHIIENITGYNFGTCVWAQGEKQKVRNIKGYNTPEQATKWVNKDNATDPRAVNGFDVVLASGNGLELSEIYGENPIERVVYVQSNDVKAWNIYSLNGDGVKFVGQAYDKICKNIYIENVKLEYDSTSLLTFNSTCLQIYWVDNWEITNVTVNNKNTTADVLLNLYSFKRNAKNVRIKNVVMTGDRGVINAVGEFASHEAETVGTIPYENIEINNVKAIKSRGRTYSTFNHYLTTPTETLCKNIKILNCNIEYQKISESGDDFLYRFDWTDTFEARGNSSNVRGHWVGGFPASAALGSYSNVMIQEDNLKASNIEQNITAMSQTMTLLAGSYLNFEIVKGNNLKSIFKGTGLSHFDWRVVNNVSNAITATGRTFHVEVFTKAAGYTSCQIISNVKTAITGTVPTTLVNYTDGAASLSVRGDTFSGSYDFKARIIL